MLSDSTLNFLSNSESDYEKSSQASQSKSKNDLFLEKESNENKKKDTVLENKKLDVQNSNENDFLKNNTMNNEKIKKPSKINDEYLFEIETNNLKNEIEKQRKEQKLKELEELREKQRKELKELVKNKNQIDKIINKKIKPFSLELLPRITRAQSMDVLSSQSNLAGYSCLLYTSDAADDP